MPGRRWVSRLVASRYHAGTVYLAFDGHRNDDRTTYLFKSADYGATWTSFKGDLPSATPVRVIREDVKNPHLLFAGTESAAYASIDDGQHWLRLMNNLPTVPVADLIVHPRDGELVAGTHGRSFYVMDIAPLQELTPEILAERRRTCSRSSRKSRSTTVCSPTTSSSRRSGSSPRTRRRARRSATT